MIVSLYDMQTLLRCVAIRCHKTVSLCHSAGEDVYLQTANWLKEEAENTEPTTFKAY